MIQRIVSVSGAAYDGHALEAMLDSLASLGVSHVEPAFIVGYTDPFDETAFTPGQVLAWRQALAASGLACHAMSSHIDLGLDDAVDVFTGRMAFAAAIGAQIVCTNAAARSRERQFRRNMAILLRRAEALDIRIALENPGDGSDNLVNTAQDGIDLVAEFGSKWLGLNYDAANTASHRPQFGDFSGDAIMALPASTHAHIKDVCRVADGWEFCAIGDGDIGCECILAAMRGVPALPISIEIPLRLSRGPDAQPRRRPQPVPMAEIEACLRLSLQRVNAELGVAGR